MSEIIQLFDIACANSTFIRWNCDLTTAASISKNRATRTGEDVAFLADNAHVDVVGIARAEVSDYFFGGHSTNEHIQSELVLAFVLLGVAAFAGQVFSITSHECFLKLVLPVLVLLLVLSLTASVCSLGCFTLLCFVAVFAAKFTYSDHPNENRSD